jgi:hypothetical protein
LSSAWKRSAKPRRLSEPVSGSAREMRARSPRRRSWLRAYQVQRIAITASEKAKKPEYSGRGCSVVSSPRRVNTNETAPM